MFGEVRTMVYEKGEPFFVGSDVAVVLGYSDPQKAVKMHVDDDDKLTRRIAVSGQNQNGQNRKQQRMLCAALAFAGAHKAPLARSV